MEELGAYIIFCFFFTTAAILMLLLAVVVVGVLWLFKAVRWAVRRCRK